MVNVYYATMRRFPLLIFCALLFVWPAAVSPAAGAPPPASTADADLTPQAGEIRLEGTLREMAPAQGRLVLLATRAQDPGRPAQGIDPPRLKVILVRPTTTLRPGPGGPPGLSAFQPGNSVIVVGKSLGRGKPLVARVLAAQ